MEKFDNKEDGNNEGDVSIDREISFNIAKETDINNKTKEEVIPKNLNILASAGGSGIIGSRTLVIIILIILVLFGVIKLIIKFKRI